MTPSIVRGDSRRKLCRGGLDVRKARPIAALVRLGGPNLQSRRSVRTATAERPRREAVALRPDLPKQSPGESDMDHPRNIVVIGGGFAGTTLARELDGRLPAGWQLLLISEESYTTFNPLLPEALGASIFPEQVVAPIRQMLKRGRFVMGRVTAIDPAAKALTCTTLAGETRLAYEHLVLAFGNRARLDLIPGLAAHALPLKTVGDAMHIRNIVLRRIARIELEDDPAIRRRLGHFVVIGGGFSGVETAGELVDCLAGVRR